MEYVVYLRGLLGVFVLLLIGWLLSANRRRPPWRVIIWGLLLQLVLAGLILGTPWGYAVFDTLAGFVAHLIGLTTQGAEFVFGDLADPTSRIGFLLAFAGNGLLVIIFFASLISILYHLGIMQVVIWCLARLMSATMGLSGAESMAGAANVFVGMTESPLMVRPYIKGMTLSELNAMMTGGFATIAGTVLAAYIGIIGEEYLTHLLTASVMSAPAAFVFAKIIRPETETPDTWGRCELRIERTAGNVIEAAADGASQGMELYLNIIAMLVAFIALVALINWPLGWLGEVAFNMPREAAGEAPADPLSLAKIFGWIFAPVAWCMGINGWNDCQLFGALLGTKMAVNEMIAFGELAKYNAQGAFADPRTPRIAAYALCGFSNFGSIGIQLGGITPLAPDRKGDLSRLALRAMIGGTLASATTATIAGMFVE